MYQDIFKNYIKSNPREEVKFKTLQRQLQEQTDAELIDRKNFVGHFTASAFILSKKSNRVALLYHNFLKKYLQPGGHIDLTDKTPIEAAKRELLEETGIHEDKLDYSAINSLTPLTPFNIDIHKIPENSKKSEKAHFHYDLQYLFFTEDEEEIKVNEEESANFEWVEWEKFEAMSDFVEISRKIQEVTKPSPERFLSKIIKNPEELAKYHCIAVQHIVKNSIPLIKILHTIFGDRLTILAKPNSIDSDALNYIKNQKIKVQTADRSNPPEIKNPTILLDIGGYFSEIAKNKNLPIKLIIEDTENGHIKYLKNIKDIKLPIISVARNPLKDNEDYLVGSGIVFGADYILRQGNNLIQFMDCACIGYGKIGRGICTQLRKNQITPTVFEKNPKRLIEALRDGNLTSRDFDIYNKEVIFCATGSHSLNIHDFRNLKNGAFIVVATSSEDELTLDYLSEEYEKIEINDFITKYKNQSNYFYILNRGVPTNFAVGASLGNFIFLIHAAILFSMSKEIKNSNTIIELSDEENSEIAKKWLDEFSR